MVKVTYCICYRTSFKEIKDLADELGLYSIEELQEHIDFGTGCGTCIKYVEKMLETGETELEIIWD